MLPTHLPNREGLPRGGFTLQRLPPTLFLFAMNQYSDRDRPRVLLLEKSHRVFTVSDSTETDIDQSKHISGHFDNARFWKSFLTHPQIAGATIILDYFWLQSGETEKYFNTRYGGERWIQKDGFIQKFLQAGGKEVFLPQDSGRVVFDMIEKHRDSWDFTVSIVRPEDNPLVQASKDFPDQSKYTYKKRLNYYCIRDIPIRRPTPTLTSLPPLNPFPEIHPLLRQTNLSTKRKRSIVNYSEIDVDKPVPKIITPVKVRGEECAWRWKELEVKKSLETGSGDGLFAKKDLAVGTMIPICGTKKKGEMKMKSHGWTYSKKDDYYIDGDPKINPYNGVGNFGLSIAMMPNERTTGVHNCQFLYNYLVVALPIKRG